MADIESYTNKEKLHYVMTLRIELLTWLKKFYFIGMAVYLRTVYFLLGWWQEIHPFISKGSLEEQDRENLANPVDLEIIHENGVLVISII